MVENENPEREANGVEGQRKPLTGEDCPKCGAKRNPMQLDVEPPIYSCSNKGCGHQWQPGRPLTEEEEDASAKMHKPVPITKETIGNTVVQMFGKDCECIWGHSNYKKRKSLRVQFKVMGRDTGFEIRDARDLVEIARTVVAIYGKVRAVIIDEMARGVAYSQDQDALKAADDMRDRIQREKDRMAGRDTSSESGSS